MLHRVHHREIPEPQFLRGRAGACDQASRAAAVGLGDRRPAGMEETA